MVGPFIICWISLCLKIHYLILSQLVATKKLKTLIINYNRKSMNTFVSCDGYITVSYRLAAAAKSLQSCPTLCDPIDGSPPGSVVPGILQARTLKWVAISLCNAWRWKVKVKSLSPVWLWAMPRTAAYQAPPSVGFSRQEYWSGVPLPSVIDLLVCGNYSVVSVGLLY